MNQENLVKACMSAMFVIKYYIKAVDAKEYNDDELRDLVDELSDVADILDKYMTEDTREKFLKWQEKMSDELWKLLESKQEEL